MRPSTLVAVPAVFCAVLFGTPASAAELYKWVDANGVTNYSSEPPPRAKGAKKFTVSEDRVSVYTPDKQLLQAMEASRQRALEDLRTGRRERELEAEHLARLRSAPATSIVPNGYDPCLDAANVDLCNNRLYSALPYYYGAAPVFAPFTRRFRPLPQAQITPGTTAGNVVGMNGFMPGNSAFIPGTMMPPPPPGAATHPGRSVGRR